MAGLPLEAAWCFNPRSGTTAFRRYATAPALRATVTVPGVKSMNAPLLLLSIAAATFASTASARAQEASTTLSPKALQEIAQVEAEIDRIEAQTLERRATPPDNQVRQVELLGKLILYDRQLSVYRNEACMFCHMPETGFTGPVSELNRTTGAYPGSVRTRFSDRKPQSHAYAPLSPVLHYNRGQGDLVGGNFWDMRATVRRRPAAGSSRAGRSRPGRRDLRSDGAIHSRLRGLRRSDRVQLEVRRGARRQGEVHAAGADRLRFVSRQGAVQFLSPRRRAGRGPPFYRLHRQQYWNPGQSAAALLRGR